ncbi:MAG: hypothetical protein JW786_13470 [Desulfobacterales bacterium]|nr:hypothetical protein [Desulfobacterales bacterium]
MYIAKKFDGTLEVLENLDEKQPDPEQLRNVEEIYLISKTLVPVMTLKPKPKEERDKILNTDRDNQTNKKTDSNSKQKKASRSES